MCIGHSASRCSKPPPARPVEAWREVLPRATPTRIPSPPRSKLEIEAVLPPPPPPPPPRGKPSLAGCVAKLEIGALDALALKDSLLSKLAAHFGGQSGDYKVASYSASALAILFPNWVARGSAIGHSPLCLDGVSLFFSDWSEPGEVARGHLRHKVWIRLRNWPILCWSTEEVAAAISAFGELWEVDDRCSSLADVSSFRVLIRCRDAGMIPASLLLVVEDRCFRIPIEVDACDEAAPILLGEDTDRRLGLDTWDDQEAFLRTAGRHSTLPGLATSRQSSAGGGARPCLPRSTRSPHGSD